MQWIEIETEKRTSELLSARAVYRIAPQEDGDKAVVLTFAGETFVSKLNYEMLRNSFLVKR